MFLNSLELIPVCSLHFTNKKEMSKSSDSTKRRTSLLNVDCLSLKKKKMRQPLKSKNNVNHVKRSMQKTPRRYGSYCSAKIDVLNKTSETVYLKSSERILRSSRCNGKLQPKDITLADKNVFKCKSKRQQNACDKKISEVSQVIPLISSNNDERRSIRRYNLPSRCNRKSVRRNKYCRVMVLDVSKTVPDELLKETVICTKDSMTLRSQQRLEKNDIQLLITSKAKRSCSVKNNLSNKRALQKSERDRSCSAEFDVLSKTPETASLKIPKRTLRSSLEPNVILQSKDITTANKSVSEHKSKRQQNISNKKNSEVHQVIPLESPNEIKRRSSDILSKTPETASLETPKRTLRSSLGSNVILQSKDITTVNKNVSERKSKRQQNISNKNNSEVPQIIPFESRNESKRHSFYRDNLISHCNKESQRQSKLCNDKETEVSMTMVQEAPEETLRSSRSSMTLQSQQFSRKKSDSLPIIAKIKHARKSLSRKNKPNVQKTKYVQRPFKCVSSIHLLKKALTAKKTKRIRKSSVKSQTRVRSKSLPGNIPVDDLALSQFRDRLTKSDRLPRKNTLKRKRYVMDAMKRADEEYEDDIFETNKKKFDYFKQILPDCSESEASFSMSTPKLGIQFTPVIQSKTPVYKDCFSPTEYALSRKLAEEYLYRNKKRKSKTNSQVETPEIPEKKKLEFNKALDDACKAQKEVEKLTEDKSDDEDNYFIDLET